MLKRPQLADESFVASHPPRGRPALAGLSEELELRTMVAQNPTGIGSRSRGRLNCPLSQANSSNTPTYAYGRNLLPSGSVVFGRISTIGNIRMAFSILRERACHCATVVRYWTCGETCVRICDRDISRVDRQFRANFLFRRSQRAVLGRGGQCPDLRFSERHVRR